MDTETCSDKIRQQEKEKKRRQVEWLRKRKIMHDGLWVVKWDDVEEAFPDLKEED